MNKTERIRAELEAKMAQFDKTISELKIKAERQNETYSALQRKTIEALEDKKREAERKLDAVSESDGTRHESLSSDLKGFMSDMDDSLRKALGHFK
jgi:uncharacterized coiled-coil protein SlyX